MKIKALSAGILFVTVSMMSGPLWADTVDAEMASTLMAQGWDFFSFVLNASSTPVSLHAWVATVESPTDYSMYLINPAPADYATAKDWNLQPGDSTLITGRVKELAGRAEHIHMSAGMTGDNVEHHTGGLQYLEMILDNEGKVVQFMGPAPHSEVPTLGQVGVDTPCRQYGVGSVGYPTQIGYRDILVIRNGPTPNPITAWILIQEPPVGSGGPFYMPCYDLGTVAPNQVVVVNLPNNLVNWAHHGGAIVNASVDNGLSWALIYMDDLGQIYGTEDKESFVYPRPLVFAPGPVNVQPADAATNVPVQPTFTWSLPDPSTYPPGLVTLGSYNVQLSTEQYPAGGRESHDVPDTACVGGTCSFTWPTVLAPGTKYYWVIYSAGQGPIVPGPTTGTNAGLPGIGPGTWGGAYNLISFTTQ